MTSILVTEGKRNLPKDSNIIILLVYAGMIAFMIYRLLKGNKIRKENCKTNPLIFKRALGIFTPIMTAVIVLLGAWNIGAGAYITGIVMIVMGIIYLLMAMDPVVISEEGIYADSKFTEWNIVKKWYTDKKNGNLTILTKQGGRQSERYVRFDKKYGDKLDDVVKKHVVKK